MNHTHRTPSSRSIRYSAGSAAKRRKGASRGSSHAPLAFPEKTVFLDIETTELSRYYDIITLLGWVSQGRYGVLVRGQDHSDLRGIMRDAQVIITFNRALFDLPFLRAAFPDRKIPPVHIDLRFLAKRVGLSAARSP